MFHSQSLSTKGPLGSIWVAAYCHKRLKKAQVTATDIPFSVDKILQDEFEVITYRVLGYFLLGVVRIFSKKVEYLFNDCHKVLIQVKGFVFSEKSRARPSKSKVLDVPTGLITLPKRFELDAFDLEVGEDAGGAHEMPQEEITLKDNAWRYEGMDQCAIREYNWEDVAGSHGICSIDHTEAEDIIPLACMDAETDLTMISQQNNMGLQTFEDNQTESLNEDKHAEGEQMRNPEGAFLSEKDKSFSEEEHDLSNLEATVNRLQEDGECEIRNASLDAGDKCLVNEAEHDLSNLEYTIDRLRESREFERGNEDFNVVAPLDGETRELVGVETEVDFIPEEANKPSQTVSLESPEPDVDMKDQPISLRVDSTPPAKLPDTAEGGLTPELMLIPTPTPKERRPTKRKRKSLFDDLIVLPNDLVKKSIRDASDLVCKRRKAPHDAYTVWKATRAFGFSEPLIPYSSSELRSLHCEKKLKMSVPCKDVEVPGKVKVSELPSGDGSSEQAGIAPETPVRQFSSKGPFESPEASRSEEMRPESPSGSATLEKEPLAAEDHGRSPIWMNEDSNTVEEATDKLYGWTGRTRTVARHLNKVFRNQKREDEAASLLQISEGRTRKECARLFYEILVLQRKGYIDVEQETSYADILIKKLPKWEQAFDVDDPKRSA